MTAQLLASELANLIQESKRKHNDLRQVCAQLRQGQRCLFRCMRRAPGTLLTRPVGC